MHGGGAFPANDQIGFEEISIALCEPAAQFLFRSTQRWQLCPIFSDMLTTTMSHDPLESTETGSGILRVGAHQNHPTWPKHNDPPPGRIIEARKLPSRTSTLMWFDGRVLQGSGAGYAAVTAAVRILAPPILLAPGSSCAPLGRPVTRAGL